MSRDKVTVPFAPWEPDKSTLSQASAEASGVIVQSGRYAPIKDLAPIKATGNLAFNALGGAGFYDRNGTVWIFLGDKNSLYRILNRAPSDISRIGGYNADPSWAWTFEQFGNTVLASARGAPLQYYTMGTSTRFEDVPGGPSQTDCVFRIREFIFSGFGRTLKNSAFNNFQDWTPDSGTQAGEVDLPQDGGNIIGGVGGQFAIVFQERKVHRLTYTGTSGPAFQRDEIEDKVGCLGPKAFTRFAGLVYFASEDGIRVTDGTGSKSIGEGRVDRYFTSRLNYPYRSQISLAVDTARKLVAVHYPATGSDVPNEMLIYSIADDRWTRADVTSDLVFEAPKQGVSLDDAEEITALVGTTNIDLINVSVDSALWLENRRQWWAVNGSKQVCTFEGANLAAVMETGFGEGSPGRKTFVSEVWPLTDAATVTAALTTKQSRLSDAAVNGGAISMSSLGMCAARAEARFIRARIQIPGGTTWTEAVGISWDAEARGER